MTKARLVTAIVIAAAGAFALAPSAFGSVLIGRNASNVELRVIRDHHQLKSLMLFRSNGHENIILAWGALNARAHPKCGKLFGPPCGPRQVEMQHMRLHRSGHLAKRLLGMKNLCKKYDGPKMPFYVVGCEAPDHTYWGLQQWRRLGRVCTKANQGRAELRLSHWNGPLAKLNLFLDWFTPHPHVQNPEHFIHLWGWYEYKGQPVFGLNWNPEGVPLDGFGRVVYVFSRNARCRHGWIHNENGLSKPWHGQFCHNYSPRGSKHWNSEGDQFYAIGMGPGVTPDVMDTPGPGLPAIFRGDNGILLNPGFNDQATVFDPVWELAANALQAKLAKGSKYCTHIH